MGSPGLRDSPGQVYGIQISNGLRNPVDHWQQDLLCHKHRNLIVSTTVRAVNGSIERGRPAPPPKLQIRGLLSVRGSSECYVSLYI